MSDADGTVAHDEFEIDEALLAELNRRKAEHEAGLRPAIPAEEVFRRIREERAAKARCATEPPNQPTGDAMSVKDAVIEMVRALPEDATWADIAEAGYSRFGDTDDENLTREEWEAAWAAECDRRMADRRAGRTVGIPAEQVMREMKEKYG